MAQHMPLLIMKRHSSTVTSNQFSLPATCCALFPVSILSAPIATHSLHGIHEYLGQCVSCLFMVSRLGNNSCTILNIVLMSSVLPYTMHKVMNSYNSPPTLLQITGPYFAYTSCPKVFALPIALGQQFLKMDPNHFWLLYIASIPFCNLILKLDYVL